MEVRILDVMAYTSVRKLYQAKLRVATGFASVAGAPIGLPPKQDEQHQTERRYQ